MASFEFGPRILSIIYFIKSFGVSYLFRVCFVFNCYLSLNVMLCCFVSCRVSRILFTSNVVLFYLIMCCN